MLKWFGVSLIVLGCGGVGLSMARQYVAQIAALKHLIIVLDYMANDLGYRQTPLPELCRCGAKLSVGIVSQVFTALAEQLESQTLSDAPGCMEQALILQKGMPDGLSTYFRQLGKSLGCFDVAGQVQGITAVRENCVKELNTLESDKTNRIRNYQTLGLCAGAALAILLI